MNEKLKKISLKLEGRIIHYNTPQEVYDTLINKVLRSQPDYFISLGPQNVIILTCLLFSYKKTGDFELGEQMLDNSMFLSLLSSNGNNYRESCGSCSGSGEVECDFCNGSGEVPCESCDATGGIDCDTCDGSGTDPDSEDDDECSDCNGAGNRTCWSCGGNEIVDCFECRNGFVNCEECDGTGEIETDKWLYDIDIILTWDSKIIETAIERENSLSPIMSIDQYLNSNDKYILIDYIADNDMEFSKRFSADAVYCFSHNDNPPLTIKYDSIKVLSIPFKNLTNYE